MASKQSSIRAFFQPRTNPLPSTNPPHSSIANQTPEPKKEREKTPAREEQQISSDIQREEESNTVQGAVISPIYETHISQLKRINALLLPINYPDNFYHKAVSPDITPNLSFVVLWNTPPLPNPSRSKIYSIRKKQQQVIGGIICRLEQNPTSSSIYIQSLALLSPYRSQGLATALLSTVIRTVVQSTLTPSSLYAHVWTENTEGLTWYKSRGFIADPVPIQNYYSRLRPGSAYLLRRVINPSDYLRYKSRGTTSSNRSSDSSGWEMVDSPDLDMNMIPKAASASVPAIIPFIAAPPPPPPSSLPPTPNPKPQTNSKSTKPPNQTYLNFPPAPAPAPAPPPPTPASTPNLPNPSKPPPPRPGLGTHTESYQNRAPESEWNDLPLDILGVVKTNNVVDSGVVGKERSRDSSRVSGKKKRFYPAAAFGGGGGKGDVS